MYRIIGFRHSQDYLECRKCKHCNAIIEYKTEYAKTKVEKNKYTEYIKCPNCRKKIIILESKLGDTNE